MPTVVLDEQWLNFRKLSFFIFNKYKYCVDILMIYNYFSYYTSKYNHELIVLIMKGRTNKKKIMVDFKLILLTF